MARQRSRKPWPGQLEFDLWGLDEPAADAEDIVADVLPARQLAAGAAGDAAGAAPKQSPTTGDQAACRATEPAPKGR